MEDKEIGDLKEEFDEYCKKYLRPLEVSKDDESSLLSESTINLFADAQYNIEMMQTIAKGLIRAKFEQEMDRRRKHEKEETGQTQNTVDQKTTNSSTEEQEEET